MTALKCCTEPTLRVDVDIADHESLGPVAILSRLRCKNCGAMFAPAAAPGRADTSVRVDHDSVAFTVGRVYRA